MVSSAKNSTESQFDNMNTIEENVLLLRIIGREMNKLSKTKKLKCYK